MAVEIRWDAFKPLSGKWTYGGVVTISGDNPIWEQKALLEEIAGLQKEVYPPVLTGGRFAIVIRETDAQAANPEYRGFFTVLYPATRL